MHSVQEYFERVEPGLVLVAHLVFRVAVLASPLHGWWNPPVLRLVAALLIGYDVALAWSLGRGRPPPRWTRWALTLAELAFWVTVHTPNEPYSGVWALTAPMITMTTVRYGLLVSGTVAAALVAFAFAVRLAGQADPFVVDTMLYAGMYLMGGQCLIALLATEVRRQRRRAQSLWEADVTAAELDGRNEIVTGRGADLIDDLQTTIMRLSASGVDASVALPSHPRARCLRRCTCGTRSTCTPRPCATANRPWPGRSSSMCLSTPGSASSQPPRPPTWLTSSPGGTYTALSL